MPTIRSLERRLDLGANALDRVGSCPRNVSLHPIPRDSGRWFNLTNDQTLGLLNHLLSHRVHWPRGQRRVGFLDRFSGVRNEFLPGTPSPNPPTTTLYSELTSTFVPPVTGEVPIEVGIGADPEFTVVSSTGHFVPFRGGSRSSDAVGCDGDGSTGELRPHWNKDPKKVYETIDGLLTTVESRVAATNKVIAGGGVGHPTGGHLHISGIGHQPSDELLEAFKTYIYLPLRGRSAGARARGSYDNALSYRTQFHGGFEWRGAPSWLAHPILTKGTLVIAAILSRNHKNLPTSKEALFDMAANADERSAAEAFYNFLAALTTEGKMLEDLDVLRTWNKRKVRATPPVVTEVPRNEVNRERETYLVNCSTDRNMPRNMVWPVPVEWTFVGASENRAEGLSLRSVFAPSSVVESLIRGSIFHRPPVFFYVWDLPSIGLAPALRETEQEARENITRILEVLAPCARS